MGRRAPAQLLEPVEDATVEVELVRDAAVVAQPAAAFWEVDVGDDEPAEGGDLHAALDVEALDAEHRVDSIRRQAAQQTDAAVTAPLGRGEVTMPGTQPPDLVGHLVGKGADLL